MKRHYASHASRHLERSMEYLVFGHGGAPVLVFPTSRGRFHQWEDFRMVECLARPLQEGWLQLFCVDGIDNETWYDFERPQAEILKLHDAYDRYLAEEFLPELRRYNQNEFLMVTGTSFGAYHAANFSFRHPHQVRRMLAMSGDFDIRQYLDCYYGLDVYYHNPVDYLGQLSDPHQLSALRRMDIILAAGRSDFCLPPSARMARTLEARGVPCRLEVWGDEAIHDWPTWKSMIQVYL